jgi:hypothetical protein
MLDQSFLERVILGGCIAALHRQNHSKSQWLAIVQVLATHDAGPWGQYATLALGRHMHDVVRELHDIITPKPMIATRPIAKGQAVTTNDVMGCGAVWFGKKTRGQA